MIVTIQQHILQEQQRFPGASGEFSWLLSGITLATKMVQARVRQAWLSHMIGSADHTNVQGETQQKLDIYANEALLYCLQSRASIGVVVSEENEKPQIMAACSPTAKYAVVFDPLDGSSNIDVSVSVGTTFSILGRPDNASCDEPEAWVLQPGTKQIAAGYVVYGSSTVMVYSAGSGVHGFTLDPSIGAYVLSHPNIRIPAGGQYYSVNEGNRESFPPGYTTCIDRLRGGALGRPYSTRYIGSMVADIHRTLLKGGIFLYPPTRDHADGKLRLLYEANPVAFLIEQAGGIATNGRERVLDIQPTSIHQRTSLVCGGQEEMQFFAKCLAEA